MQSDMAHPSLRNGCRVLRTVAEAPSLLSERGGGDSMVLILLHTPLFVGSHSTHVGGVRSLPRMMSFSGLDAEN